MLDFHPASTASTVKSTIVRNFHDTAVLSFVEDSSAGEPDSWARIVATTKIAKGEVVMVKGGHIITREQLRDINTRLGPVEIQIGDDLFIAPVTDEERELSMLYSNHSCDPNLGLRGEITFVAMRDIRADEELTHDWAMTDDDDSSTKCNCGSSNCRGTLTGKDWQRSRIAKTLRWIFLGVSSRKNLRPRACVILR